MSGIKHQINYMIRTSLVKPFFTLALLLIALSSSAQDLEGVKIAPNIGLFHAPGYEPPEKHKSVGPDTANFKPENFSFPNIQRKTLDYWLGKDVPLQPVSCKPFWGMFTFRVNASKKVDSTWYRGNLPPDASEKILANIRGTEGIWIIKPGTKSTHVAWYVYLFFDIRGKHAQELKCTDEDKKLMSAVTELSNLFSLLYFRVDRDIKRATMLMPTEIDGVPN